MSTLRGKIITYLEDSDAKTLISQISEQFNMSFTFCETLDEIVELCQIQDADILLIDDTIDKVIQPKIINLFKRRNRSIEVVLVQCTQKQCDLPALFDSGFTHCFANTANAENTAALLYGILENQKEKIETVKSQTLLPIYRLGEKFLSVNSEQDVFNDLIEIISTVINTPSVSVMMYDEISKSLKIVAAKGGSGAVSPKSSVKPGERVSGWVYSKGEPVILNKQTQHQSPVAKFLDRSDIQAAISFPLIYQDQTIGVVNISENQEGAYYTQSELDLLTIVCRQAAAAYGSVKVRQEREQSVRLKTLFQQYVSPEIAEILLSRQQNLMQIGAIEELTVLFADIRNFTLLVQKVEPAELRKFLNRFFDLFADAVYLHRGTLDKFMGDAALVYFGSPVSIAQPKQVAVTTAVEIVHRFEEMRKIWIDRHLCFKEIGLGIGISHGEMFLGNVGSSRRFDYTVIGTDVNIAQRLANDAQSGEILITKKVYNAVSGEYQCVKMPSRMLRSIEKEIDIYSVEL